MIFQASHKFARIAASKVRPFAELVRGRGAKEGMDLLRYVPNRGAAMLLKVLKSAMANAEDRGERGVEELPITISQVDEGPMFKRLHARARGMAYLIRRRFAHITIGVGVITDAERETVANAKEANVKEAAARKARLQEAKSKRQAAKV
ncbi:MAG: rplV [Planctomycetaceae bacterium]|nr:rplV [Planctomycetaceae bacterium]